VIALYLRFKSLDRPARRLVLEAASLMAFAWIGLRLLRYATVRQVLDHYAGSSAAGNAGQPHPNVIGPVRWAITAVAARFPLATCLVQALAADAMLRRRGLGSEVCMGVRVGSKSAVPIEAHAWVECEGAVAIGAIEHLSDFEVLTTLRPQ
jgi:hypothetical protein